MQKSILIIDDDFKLHEAVRDYFSPDGYRVDSLSGGQEALTWLSRRKVDIILLDVMLPGGLDGFEVLRAIRAESTVPVIMISARGDEADRVIGLELGADDYLAKPFSLRELLARVKGVLRRVAESANDRPSPEVRTTAVISGAFVLELNRRRLSWGKSRVEISTTEANILKALMEHPDTVLARELLIQLAMGADYNTTDRSIDVHISRLRKQLKKLTPHLSPIQTIWRSGYCWTGYE
jgi:two-component system phosphate regulon response regulator OmpR